MSSTKIGPGDPRYRAVVDKRFNKRFSASPTTSAWSARPIRSSSAVEEAVSEGRRLVVTSGGHCLEGFVSDPEVRVIIDVSPMKRVYYDADKARRRRRGRRHGGRDVPGAVRDVGRRDPARRVSGDRHGRACGRRRLRLPLPPARPRRGLSVCRRGGHRGRGADARAAWWRRARRPIRIAISGGRTPAAAAATSASSRGTGSDRRTHPATTPPTLLPRAPESITTFKAEWNWSDIDRPSFLRLLRNHGIWCERNSDADSPNASLWTLLRSIASNSARSSSAA